MPLLKSLHHIAIICSNYQKSKHFYTNVLGLTIVKEIYRKEINSYKLDLALNETYIIELFSFPDSPLRPTHPEATGLRHIAFSVDNIEEVVRHLNLHTIETEPIRTDGFTSKKFTFFRDPDDLPIEIYEG